MRYTMNRFIEVKDVTKVFKVSKRTKGIPGMMANMFFPRNGKDF